MQKDNEGKDEFTKKSEEINKLMYENKPVKGNPKNTYTIRGRSIK